MDLVGFLIHSYLHLHLFKLTLLHNDLFLVFFAIHSAANKSNIELCELSITFETWVRLRLGWGLARPFCSALGVTWPFCSALGVAWPFCLTVEFSPLLPRRVPCFPQLPRVFLASTTCLTVFLSPP